MIATSRALICLARDTFARAWASRMSGLMLAGIVLCIALALSVSITGGTTRGDDDGLLYGADGQPRTMAADPAPGALTLAFGLVRVPLFRDGPAMVAFLHVLLAQCVAGAVGTLLFLVWTAGIVPESLRPSEAVFLLSRPVGLRTLVAGKTAGVLLFVASHVTLFVVGTWAALGVRTGVWNASYLATAPLLILNFTACFGAALLLGTWSRSGAVAAIAGVSFWLAGFLTNTAHASANLVATGGPLRGLVGVAYWLLPKPGDLAAVADRALDAASHISAINTPPAPDAVHLALIALSSIAVLALMIDLSARALASQEA